MTAAAARLGDRIACRVLYPYPQQIVMTLLTPESVAYANELMQRPGSGWTILPPDSPAQP